MGVPHSTNARLFYRAAKQRFEDAELLLKEDRTTGAVYLAGYGVECMLKALLLAAIPEKAQKQMRESFRGRKGHDLDGLKALYVEKGKQGIPSAIGKCLARVNSWATDLRYSPASLKAREAKQFLRDAAEILRWAEERL